MTESKELILETCLLAGKIMLESGSEVYRAEDTMYRISASAGEPNSVNYITATGIFMGFKGYHSTQVENVGERSINLEKVVAVNQLSRAFSEKSIDLPTLYESLKQVDYEVPHFPVWLQIVSAGILSCLLMSIFGGSWNDFIPTFIIGLFGYAIKHYVKQAINLRFFDNFLASFFIGSVAIFTVHYQLAGNIDNIIIGSVMALVPGVAITTSFRDILAGHLISGLARGTEAIIIASSIGVGIASSFIFFGGMIL